MTKNGIVCNVYIINIRRTWEITYAYCSLNNCYIDIFFFKSIQVKDSSKFSSY